MAKTLADMTTEERAVKVLNDVGEYIDHLEASTAYVTALEAAGLLAPDLPDPELYEEETAYWYEDTYGIGVGRLTKNSPVRVMLWDSEPGGVLYTNIESARDYALKILAACEYAEKEQGNE